MAILIYEFDILVDSCQLVFKFVTYDVLLLKVQKCLWFTVDMGGSKIFLEGEGQEYFVSATKMTMK